MQNSAKHEVNQNILRNSPISKFGLFTVVGLLMTTVLVGGVYYLSKTEDTPPELTAKRSTYQAFSKDAEFGATKWEKADAKTYDDKITELKKSGIDVSKTKKAEKDKVNIFFAAQDTNLQEIMDATSRKEGGRIIFGVYQSDKGQFVTTQNDYFNTTDKKGNKILMVIDSSKQAELQKVTISGGEAVFVMADYSPELLLVKSETDAPQSNLPISYFTKGWHAVAMTSDYFQELLKDVDPATYSIWGTKNNKDFIKMKTPDEKKSYNNIVWINIKTDKLTKQSADDKSATDTKDVAIKVTLDTNSVSSTEIKQGSIKVSLATFDISQNKDITINKITLDYTGISGKKGANDIKKIYVLDGKNELIAIPNPVFPKTFDTEIKITKDIKSVIEIKADIEDNAYAATDNNKHAIKITELEFSDGTNTKKVTPNAEGNTMTIIQSDVETANAKPVVTVNPIYTTIDSAQNMPISWKVTDAKQTQYTDAAKTKPTLSYTWIFTDITDSAKPVDLWKLTPQWGAKDGETGVITEKLDGNCFQKLYGEDGKQLATGRDWICEQMTIEKIRLAPGKEYKMEVTAFDGSLSSDPASVTFKTKAANLNTKLELKNGAVTGSAVDSDGLIDLAKELKFTWDPTYDSTKIAQYKDTGKKEPALSYTLKLTDNIGQKIIWELSKEWGAGTQGITDYDKDCFNQLYDANGKPLQISGADNKDWMCSYFTVPSYLKNTPYMGQDTKYTLEITADDGTNTTASTSIIFTTKK